MKRILASAVFGLTLGMAGTVQAGQTLDSVKAKAQLACGVSTGTAGFAMPDSQGTFKGLDVDICHALSAAIFGAPDKVRYVPLSAPQRFTALQSGEVDVLARNTTWTLQREGSLGLLFAPVTFYDGQGFMVAKKLGLKSAKELSGATICVQPGTTTELNLADYFRANKLTLKSVTIENLDEVENAFFSGRCDAYTTDASGLAGTRISKAPAPDDIVSWTVYALFDAEELGITQANVDEMLKSGDPNTQRLLGVTQGNGKALGLDEKWAYNIIKSTGNYGEIFDRNVGKNSPIKLDRGLNNLWNAGGLLYSPPAR